MSKDKKLNDYISVLKVKLSSQLSKIDIYVSIGVILLLSFVGYCFNQNQFLNGIIPLLSALLGAGASWIFLNYDKEQEYISNARNVLLIMCVQLNRFACILRDFKEFSDKYNESGALPPAYYITPSEWELTKSEIVSLHHKKSNEDIMILLYDLMFLSNEYVGLIHSINDYNHKLIQKNMDDSIELSENERKNQIRLFELINIRVKKLGDDSKNNKFVKNIILIHAYLKNNYPKKSFPMPDIKVNCNKTSTGLPGGDDVT